MLTLIVVAAAGCVVGLRSTPFAWMFGGVLAFTICVATALAGWSWVAVLQSLACLIAFNLIALGVSVLKLSRRDLKSPSSSNLEPEAGLQTASKTAS